MRRGVFSSTYDDSCLRGPRADVALLDRGRHRLWEEVRRSSERRYAQRGEPLRVFVVVRRGAVVRQRASSSIT
jgi:hypothetical protein